MQGMRDNHTPARGIKDLSPPEGVLVPPEGREAQGRHKNARRRAQILKPEGWGVIITLLYGRADLY